MKAYTLLEFGDIGNLQVTEIEKPKSGSGQVLIRAKATSVNPVDYKIRSGAASFFAPLAPRILHGDVAGIVDQVGAGVTTFKPGDEVYGCIGGVGPRQGALAEFVIADASLLAKKPKALSFREAAALPLVAITAWEALIDKAEIQPGQIVLVHAGAGGVGHIGVQLAKAKGAVVHTTVSSEEKAKLARELGADVVINYKKQSVGSYVAELTSGRGYDVVFDTVGGKNIEASFEAAKVYGTVVSCQAANPAVDLRATAMKSLNFHAVLMLIPLLGGEEQAAMRTHQGQIMASISELVDAGKLKPIVDEKRFGFSDVGLAHRRAESGEQVGKVVVEF